MSKMLRWSPEQLAAHQARQPKPAPAVPAVVEDHQPAANLPECHFAVPGQPVPKGRARFARVGAGVRTFTPEKTARYENLVRMQADAAMQGREPMRGPIRLDVNVWLQVPASWSKKRRAAALAGDIAATKKPDADNVLKAVKDGMNGVVYADDSQVVEVRVSKRYSATPSVVVLATELNKESA